MESAQRVDRDSGEERHGSSSVSADGRGKATSNSSQSRPVDDKNNITEAGTIQLETLSTGYAVTPKKKI